MLVFGTLNPSKVSTLLVIWSHIGFHLECLFWTPGKCRSHVHLPWGKICGASLISLLLSLFTCLPFGVVREVREHLEETLIRDMKLDQNGKAVGCKTKTISWKALQHSGELGGLADFGDNLLDFCHYYWHPLVMQNICVHPDYVVTNKLMLWCLFFTHHTHTQPVLLTSAMAHIKCFLGLWPSLRLRPNQWWHLVGLLGNLLSTETREMFVTWTGNREILKWNTFL